MRTTLDLPDQLMRELKARAAMQGVKLKAYLAQMVEADLHRPALGRSEAKRSPVPVYHRKVAKAMPALSNARLNALMDAQDADKTTDGENACGQGANRRPDHCIVAGCGAAR